MGEKFVQVVNWARKLKFCMLAQNVVIHKEHEEYLGWFQSRRLKKIGKIRLGSKLSLGFIYGLSFRIQAAYYFSQFWVQKTGLTFYLADFHARNWRISGFYENITQFEPYSPLKPTKVGFIFIGPNSLSRVEDLAVVNHWHKLSLELGRRLSLKVGFKELRLEPKFLNRGLC